LKGYNKRFAIDPFEKKAVMKDNSLRNLAVFIGIVAFIIFLVL